jgi:glucose/arabinose dehydrogenase
MRAVTIIVGLVVLGLTSIGLFVLSSQHRAKLSPESGMGANPQLPAPPASTMLPTVDVARAQGWSPGMKPKAAPGFAVVPFAGGLDHPRWLYTLPNGDILVAESNAPPRPEDGKGVKGGAMKAVMTYVGAAVPSANRITLLRDADGDGIAEIKTPFITGLNSPFGMVVIGNELFVANTDAVVRFPYTAGQMKIDVPPVKLADLPGGALNHHWTKNIIASRDGSTIYAAVGSNSNIAENGMDKEVNRAAILAIDVASGATRLFASGLRNPVGMALEPTTGELWTAVNERDELGSDLVPDYMTSVRDGGFYGWPYSYFGQHVDTRVTPQRPDLVASAIVPDYALGPHTASLGLAFHRFGGIEGALIGQHGSWNRTPPSGYKVIMIPFANGKPSGAPMDILTGFRDGGTAYGRPVGVSVDKAGAVLVADDVGNIIWRVTSTSSAKQ